MITFMSRPYRAYLFSIFIPRALPWAGMYRPVGALLSYVLMLRVLLWMANINRSAQLSRFFAIAEPVFIYYILA